MRTEISDADLSTGTAVYYTGDVANQPASGRVVGVVRNARFGDQYRLELEDLEGETHIAHLSLADFQPGPGRRFWLMDDWQEDRNRRIQEGQESMWRALGRCPNCGGDLTAATAACRAEGGRAAEFCGADCSLAFYARHDR